MKRALPLVAVVLIASLGAVWWWSTARGPQAPSSVSSSAEYTSTATSSATAPLSTGQASAPESKGVVAPPPAANVSPSFVNFLVTDAKLLSSMHIDEKAAGERLDAQAAAMGPAEVGYARELALTAKAPANERILAVAALASSKANFALVLPALTDLITKGMNSARAEPHTVEEISNAQAKAFALMAVDAIAERAATDATARAELQRLENAAKDETIRKYIRDKLRGLPPL